MIKSRFFRVLSVLLAIAILILLSYEEDKVKISPAYQKSSMENLYLKHKEGNRVDWELTSDEAILPVEKKEIHLKSLALKINQSPEINLTSGSGIYDIDKGNVALHKPVELTIKDARFMTDSLLWNSSDETIHTEDEITFTGDAFLITGLGLFAKVQQQKVRILKDVKATFYR